MTDREDPPVIGCYEYIRYTDPADAFRPYDPRCPEVARRVIDLIEARLPEVTVEHVGSTAIPGCAGKGVIDLMLLYPPGRLAAAREALDALGFQRDERPGAFPEERPVRLGTLTHDGSSFRLHVHVLAAGAPEVVAQRHFRDRLRADPTLVAAYVDRKRAVLFAGVADSDQYNQGKHHFIQEVIADTPDATSASPQQRRGVRS